MILRFLRELVAVFLDAAPYILLGFSVAAVIQVLLPVGLVRRLFGKGRVRPILVASALGIPLPLCSCSVLPTALALRKRGASKGATVSFLVSTPETGIDSIALTWGLLDPLMAIFRPLAAIITAITAGFATEALGGTDEEEASRAPEDSAPVDVACACGPEDTEPTRAAHDHGDSSHAGHSHDVLEREERAAADLAGRPFRERLRHGFRSAFVELFDETSHWMLAGLVISAVIAVLLPANVVTRYLSSGPVPIFLMLVIGIPLYICASASTPIAAALVIKGLSPGAALVFLLAGPATNIGSLAILSRFLGRRVMVIYLATIAIVSVALGFLLDAVYTAAKIDPSAVAGQVRMLPNWVSWPSAIVFAILLLISFRRSSPPPEFRSIARTLGRWTGFRIGKRGLARLGLALLALWVASRFVVTVPPGSRALVTRFGAPAGEPKGPGLHLRWPAPFGEAQVISADGVRRLEIGFRSGTADAAGAPSGVEDLRTLEEESLFLTGDENLVSTQCAVQYRVPDPARFRWAFSDPDGVLRLETIAALLDVLGQYAIDEVYTTDRRVVEDVVVKDLRRRVETLGLGVEIVGFQMRDVHAPPEVHAAFRDVASAQEDKQTAINVAWRYRDETINLARGEAARQGEVARSDSTSRVLGAAGDSEALVQKASAYRAHPEGTFRRLYLETVEEVLSRGRKIIRPGWQGSGDIDLWISTGKGTPSPAADVVRGGEVRKSQRTEE
ncbi:MAG: SO_0444 family Cu/Zn efflux transporter [bacterium]